MNPRRTAVRDASEREIQAKQDEIDRLRFLQMEKERLASQRYQWEGGVTEAMATYTRLCAQLDRPAYGPEQAANVLLQTGGTAPVGQPLAADEALRRHAPAIKKVLFERTVGAARKALADFKKQNAAALAKLPPPDGKSPAPVASGPIDVKREIATGFGNFSGYEPKCGCDARPA